MGEQAMTNGRAGNEWEDDKRVQFTHVNAVALSPGSGITVKMRKLRSKFRD
jgi:hypothetical protein